MRSAPLSITGLLLAVLVLGLPAKAADQPDAQVRTDVSTLVKGDNEFALDLYARLRQAEGNLFFSPYSISTALAMTYAGARGETATQMAKVLHFRLGQKQLHAARTELTHQLNGNGLSREYQLNVANSLWAERHISFLDGYQQLLEANYGSRIRPVDFRSDPGNARQQINRWVEENTNDKIKELLAPSDVNSLTALVLVNAIYFKAAWQSPFSPTATKKDAPFAVMTGKTVPVNMMWQTGSFNYLDAGNLQVLECPYGQGELSFVVLLPKENDGLAKVEKSLTAAKLDAWLADLKPHNIDVELPKFKTTGRFELSAVLSNMGMPLAFAAAGDLSGMTKEERLWISRGIHQAFVDVNEQGTEAAAATAVHMTKGIHPVAPVVFRADHPFLFLVHDTGSGSILFLGRVTNPNAGGDAGTARSAQP